MEEKLPVIHAVCGARGKVEILSRIWLLYQVGGIVAIERKNLLVQHWSRLAAYWKSYRRAAGESRRRPIRARYLRTVGEHYPRAVREGCQRPECYQRAVVVFPVLGIHRLQTTNGSFDEAPDQLCHVRVEMRVEPITEGPLLDGDVFLNGRSGPAPVRLVHLVATNIGVQVAVKLD